MDISKSIWIYIGIAVVGISLAWVLLLKVYLYFTTKFYQERRIKVTGLKADSSNTEKALGLFFFRQQTYEFSAYGILLISIFLLLASIYVFVFANTIVLNSTREYQFKNNEFIISVTSVRIGISVIVFFICQVLLRLYRYCLKFSAFYIGLFDALFMQKEIQKDIKDSIEIFMPKMDVGKEPPKSPSQELAEILVNLNKAANASSKGKEE